MPVISKRTRAERATVTCDALTEQATTPDDAVRAARWAGQFAILTAYAGFLSAAIIDGHIAMAREMLPGFDDQMPDGT